MKTLKIYRYWFTVAVIMIQIFCTLPGNGSTIYSTSTGGNWNAPSTWEGNQVPGANDAVIIRSGATVSAFLGTSNTCAGLTIQQTAILVNNGSSATTLTVSGPFSNYGTVKNGNAYLTLIIGQDVIYDGAEWSNYKVTLQGNVSQAILFGIGKSFTGQYFTVEGTIRQISASGNLAFIASSIDFNGSTLVMADQCRLSVSGQSLSDIILTGTGNRLSMKLGAVIYNSTLTGTLLQDTVRNGSNNLLLVSTVVVDSNAMLANFGSSHTVNVNGSIHNKGTITNGSNLLTMNITGDLIQDGVWDNYSTNLSGITDQHITLGDGQFFAGQQFYNSNATLKSVIALTGLEFRGTNVNFAYGASGGTRGTLILPDDGSLKVNGLGNPALLSRINLASAGSSARLETTNGCYIQSFSNTCNILKLYGAILVGNNEFFLNNEVQVFNNLMNYSVNGHVMYVTGTLVNLGNILNGTGTLDINISGNIVHHGLEWSNNKVVITGTGSRSVKQAPYSHFDVSYFETSGALSISAGSGLTFNLTKINVFNSVISFTANDSLIIRGSDARLLNCTINGDIHFQMTDGAWLQTVVFNNEVTFSGLIPVYNNAVFLNGNVRSYADIRNQNSTPHTLYINGDFYNGGSVSNGLLMGNLILELRGNITGDGPWTNFENRVNGVSDQHIRLVNNTPVNAKFLLYANLAGSNFQWYKNGAIIPGATSAVLTLNSLSPSEYGVYQCFSSQGPSRLITINRMPAADFAASPTDGCLPSAVTFSGLSVTGFPLQTQTWDFGDGSVFVGQDPVYTYDTAGTYTVSLTISDGYLTSSMTRPGLIHVYSAPEVNFSGSDVCFGTANLFDDLTTGITRDNQFLTQYASEITGFSSQYTSEAWSAQQALGPPDVFPAHADSVTAWASLTANGQREFLSLRFPVPVRSTGVVIFETLYPGAVDSVYIRDLTTGNWALVWSGTASPLPLVARDFRVNFPLTSFFTDEVRIAINSPAVAYWNEIDAVALLSPADTVIGQNTTYQWQMGDGGPVLDTKGDLQYIFPEPGNYDVTLTVTNNGICTGTKTLPVTVLPLVEGGSVSGSKTIMFGLSTGNLLLNGYSGNILMWQKRVNGGTWEDVAFTEPLYEEIPSSTGVWQYRAQVQSGFCGTELSSPATVVVLKPPVVTWNGQVDSCWIVAANWTPPYVPDGMIDAVIPNVSPRPFPVLDSNGACRKLEVYPDATVIIHSEVVLTIMDDCILLNP